MILFACPNPSCQKRYSVAEKSAGKTVTCKNPDCGTRIQVPYPAPKPGPVPGDLIDEETGAVIKHWQDEDPAENTAPEVREQPVEEEYIPPLRRSSRRRRGRRSSANPTVTVIAGAAVGAAVMTPLAVLLSQYWPVFGGFLEKTFAQPWSAARLALIPVHLFAFLLAGVLLGGAIALIRAISDQR